MIIGHDDVMCNRCERGTIHSKGQYIVVTDIPGAFVHVVMDTDVHMLLEGTISREL